MLTRGFTMNHQKNIYSVCYTTKNHQGLEEIEIEYQRGIVRRLLGRPARISRYTYVQPSYSGTGYWVDDTNVPVSAHMALILNQYRTCLVKKID